MSGVSFTEEMRGYAGFGELDFVRGYREGRELDTQLVFHLTIELPDATDLAGDASAHGYVECHALGGRREVERGTFNCFVDASRHGVKNMLYRLWFSDGVGHPLTLTGFKVIDRGGALDIWPDTSTLYTRVLRGHTAPAEDGHAELVASGIMRIRKRDFARQLTTFRGDVIPFNRRFAAQLWELYGGRRLLLRRGAPQITAG